jgi:hypothetical protein
MKTPATPKQNDTVNRAQLARMMGVSLPTIDDWQRRGCPVAETGGKGRSYGFNVQEVIEWRVKDERKRQGLSALGGTHAGEPIHNPLRLLCTDAVRSFMGLAYSEQMVGWMLEDLQKLGGDRLATLQALGQIYTSHFMAFQEWVRGDRFNKQLDGGMDETVARGNRTLRFIPGPLPVEETEEVPKGMQAMLIELQKLRGEDPAAGQELSEENSSETQTPS